MIFWVTFFPLISEAITGTQVSVGPPAFRPFVVPLALLLVAAVGDRADHRVAARDARRSCAAGSPSRSPTAFATLVVLLVASDADRHAFALTMFVFGTFVLAAVAQEFFRGVARAAGDDARGAAGGVLAPGPAQPPALRRLHRPRRRRGGADRRRRVDVVPALALRDARARAERPDRRLRRSAT